MPPWRDQTYCPRRTSSLQSSTGEAPGKDFYQAHQAFVFHMVTADFNLMWGLNLAWDTEKWFVAQSKWDGFCAYAYHVQAYVPDFHQSQIIPSTCQSPQSMPLPLARRHSTVLSLLTLLAGSTSGFIQDMEWDITTSEELGPPAFLNSTFT